MQLEQQFKNFDAPSWPQAVRIDWRRLEHDDLTADPRDYLFQDDDYRAEDQARLDAFNRGDWSFIGIQAEATIFVPIGGNSFSTYTLTSLGVWGIESDSGEDYLKEVYDDEQQALLVALDQIDRFVLAVKA